MKPIKLIKSNNGGSYSAMLGGLLRLDIRLEMYPRSEGEERKWVFHLVGSHESGPVGTDGASRYFDTPEEAFEVGLPWALDALAICIGDARSIMESGLNPK